MRLSDFDYHLPEELIATAPAEPRDHSRLMLVDRATGARRHGIFHELPGALRAGDLLVVNDTRVFPARLFGRGPGDRRFEVLLLKRDGDRWSCLARPGRKVKGETPLRFEGGVTGALNREGDAFFIRFAPMADFFSWIEKAGVPPLPPYIKREATEQDKATYQTVFARETGSIAAPTAGLHFTDELLGRLDAKGVTRAHVTLHVGYGTFAPIQAEDVASHVMHEESYVVPPETVERLKATRESGGRIIAVGTTALRALESLPVHGPIGSTRLFIRPGYVFRNVDGLITNFHLPQSTLLVLVAAFLGLEATRACYEDAIREGYRFYSYGDAMAILP